MGLRPACRDSVCARLRDVAVAEPEIPELDQGGLYPPVAAVFIVQHPEGHPAGAREELGDLPDGVQVFYVHDDFHAPIMNGKRGLFQAHFILDKTWAGLVRIGCLSSLCLMSKRTRPGSE